MLLVLSSSEDETANYVCRTMKGAPLVPPFLRIDTDLCSSLLTLSFDRSGPCLRVDGHLFRPADFDVVWYRRPAPIVINSVDNTEELAYLAGEWAEALEGFLAHIPESSWVNHPANNALASHKLEQLTRASLLGFVIPETLLTQDPEALIDFAANSESLIVKPLSSGTLRRGSAMGFVYTSIVEPSDLLNRDLVKACPTFFQKKIDKQFDVRVTIIDEFLHATALSFAHPGDAVVDVRRDNMRNILYRDVDLPLSVKTLLVALVKSYNLRFAAIDMALSRTGEWVFFELNPNGQWAWLDLAGGQKITPSIIAALSSNNP